MSKRYGGERIKSGLLHFVIGKGVSAIAGLITVLLVIRELSVDSFAVYSILVALVEIVTALSGFGFAHALLRYVPELYAKHYQVSMRNFVYGSLLLRTLILVLVVLGAYFFTPSLTPLIGLGNAIEAFQLFLLVVIFRSTTHFVSQILESTLHQGITQFGFSISAIARLFGLLFLLYQGKVELINVIWTEVIGDALSLLVMLLGVVGVVSDRDSEYKDLSDDGSWLHKNFKPIAKFALSGYLQHLAILPYGGYSNRLVGGSMLSSGAMATYGFSQSIYEYIRRYMPSQLLVGLIRPVVVARYCEKNDFSVAAAMCGKVLQINVLLIGGIACALVVGGSDVLAGISAGKYGNEALAILGMLLFVLLLETQRQQLELLVQTIERYDYLVSSNILLSASIGAAIVLLPHFGAVAFPGANALGLVLGNAWVQLKMKKGSFYFQHDWHATVRMLVIFEVGVLLGDTAKYLGLHWLWAMLLSSVLYAILSYILFGSMLRRFAGDLTGKNKKAI